MADKSNDDFPELLTRHEAAAILRCSLNALDQRLKEPDGPPVIHVGRKVMLPKDGFAAWLRAGGSKR